MLFYASKIKKSKLTDIKGEYRPRSVEHLSPANVRGIQVSEPTPYVRWASSFSSLPREFVSGYSAPPLSFKPNIPLSNFHFDLESVSSLNGSLIYVFPFSFLCSNMNTVLLSLSAPQYM